jgi:hypothetical protein
MTNRSLSPLKPSTTHSIHTVLAGGSKFRYQIASQCVGPFRPSDLSFDISAVRNIFDCWQTMRSKYAAIFLECGAKSHHKINQDI